MQLPRNSQPLVLLGREHPPRALQTLGLELVEHLVVGLRELGSLRRGAWDLQALSGLQRVNAPQECGQVGQWGERVAQQQGVGDERHGQGDGEDGSIVGGDVHEWGGHHDGDRDGHRGDDGAVQSEHPPEERQVAAGCRRRSVGVKRRGVGDRGGGAPRNSAGGAIRVPAEAGLPIGAIRDGLRETGLLVRLLHAESR